MHIRHNRRPLHAYDYTRFCACARIARFETSSCPNLRPRYYEKKKSQTNIWNFFLVLGVGVEPTKAEAGRFTV